MCSTLIDEVPCILNAAYSNGFHEKPPLLSLNKSACVQQAVSALQRQPLKNALCLTSVKAPVTIQICALAGCRYKAFQ
jgi:hypothetical protein